MAGAEGAEGAEGVEGAEGAEGAVARARAERDAAEASLRERLRERRGLSPEDASTSVTAMLAPAAPGSYNGYSEGHSKGHSKGYSKVQATAARVAASSRCRSHRRRAGERTAAGDFTQMRLTMWLVGS